MRSVFICLIIIVLLPILHSCKKEINDIQPPQAKNFKEVFEQFWEGLNRNYLYWDLDTINWDHHYRKYASLFNKLNVDNSNDARTAQRYFREMANGLIDGHLQIEFSGSFFEPSIYYPSLLNKKLNNTYHDPYDYTRHISKYLDPGYSFVQGEGINNQHDKLSIITGTIKDKILYFRCNQFALAANYQLVASQEVRHTLELFFSRLKSDSFKGLIIDLRNNFGGDVKDLNFFVGHLINTPLIIGATQYKLGTGKFDYTPWIKARIPPLNEKPCNYPIYVLTDNFTVSLAETIAMAISALPNGKTIGEKTWGATGPMGKNELYNAGGFNIAGFMSVHTSSARFKYIDNKIYEGVGFPATIHVPYNYSLVSAGRDPILEKALESL